VGIIFIYLLVCAGSLMIGKPTIKIDYAAWLGNIMRQGRTERLNAKPYFDKAASLAVEGTQIPDILVMSNLDWPSDMNNLQRRAIDNILKGNYESFEIMRDAVQIPYYWSEYDTKYELFNYTLYNSLVRLTEVLPDWIIQDSILTKDEFKENVSKPFTGYRYLARLMAMQIQWNAYNGNTEQAIEDYIVLQKFACLLRHGRLMEQTVSFMIESLASNALYTMLNKVEIPADLLHKIHQELQKIYSEQEKTINFEAEKAFLYDYIQRTFTDNGEGNGRALIKALPLVTKDKIDSAVQFVFLQYPDRKETRKMIDRYFNQVEKLFEQTPWQTGSEEINDELAEYENESFLLSLSKHAISQFRKIKWRLRTSQLATLTILAILQYEKENGKYPVNLNEIVEQGYLESMPIDPFSGKPFVYKNTEDDFILYSIGEDFKDDGGEVYRDDRGRLRMWAATGDWVLWPVQD
jgi:hypothetical protein